MKRRWRRPHLSRQPAEVNITAFMNLMVILVPFLLITAVFSRITVLQLDMPAQSTQPQQAPEEPPLLLEVIVRQNSIEVGDRKRGLLERVEATEDGTDLEAVSRVLQEVKARFPDEQEVTLLLETDIPYDRLVQMMDTLRSVPVKQDEEVIMAELFPAISIGDAPPAGNNEVKGKDS